VIAILSNTYSELSQYKRGLFNHSVMRTIPLY
jgi:hypothetical protein